MTGGTFSPTPASPVRFEIDMTLTSASVETFRSGVWAADCDREEYVFFAFNQPGWHANSTTTFVWPTAGEGRRLAAYNCCGFGDLDATRHVELVADGEFITVIMDGIEGGRAPFEFDNISFGYPFLLRLLRALRGRFSSSLGRRTLT